MLPPDLSESQKNARKISFAVARDAVVPLLLRDGNFFGFEGKAEESMMLVRLDATTGKRIERIARVRTGGSYAQTLDGTKLVYTTGDDLLVIDLVAKRGRKLPRDSFGHLVGLLGATSVVEQGSDDAVEEDLETGVRAWAGVIDHFQYLERSGRRLLALLPEDILSVDLQTGAIARYAVPTRVSGPDSSNRRSHVALSDDGSYLVSGIGDQTTIFNVLDPLHPQPITTYPAGLFQASFVPDSGIVRLLVGGPIGTRVYDAVQRKEVPLLDGPKRELPLPLDRIAKLGTLPLGGKVCAFDEATDTVALCSHDFISLARPLGHHLETIRLTFPFGRAGGMAIDEQGYFDFFGDVPAWFRSAAACGFDWPIEVCSDRFEVSGLLPRFLRGDLSYRSP